MYLKCNECKYYVWCPISSAQSTWLKISIESYQPNRAKEKECVFGTWNVCKKMWIAQQLSMGSERFCSDFAAGSFFKLLR